MSSPYGPPVGGGPHGQGAYGAAGQSSWGAPAGQPSPAGQSYGAPGPAGPGYGAPAGQGGASGPWPSYGPGFGGQPGQSPGGPGQRAGVPDAPRAAPSAPVDLGRLLPFVVGGLGVLGFFFGFLPSFSYGAGPGGGTPVSASVYGGGPSYLPILLLIAGLLAVAPLLPGGRNYLLPSALLSVAGLLGGIAALLGGNVFDSAVAPGGLGSSSTGTGLILLVVVAVLQAAAAGYAWLLGSVGRKAPASKQDGSTSPGQAAPGGSPLAPPAGGFGGYPPTGYLPYRDGASTGQYGRDGQDDGPPPDVTQHVRF